jgi:hypothetical protein
MSTILPAFINTNINGIPAIRSNSVTVGTADVRFDFNNHRNVGRAFRGLLIVFLAQPIPTGTTDTLPIVFTSDSGNPKEVTTFNGDAVTVADIPGTGVYLFWYESQTDTLQLLTGALT